MMKICNNQRANSIKVLTTKKCEGKNFVFFINSKVNSKAIFLNPT